MSTDATVNAARRTRVLDALGDRAAMILPAAPELFAAGDTELRYGPDPDLYYLTGYTEPAAVAVLHPDYEDARFTLFVRPRDPVQEAWTGSRGGPDAARQVFGADAAYPMADMPERLPKLVADANTLYFRVGSGRERVEALVRDTVIHARKARQRKGRGPRAVVDPGAILDAMRLIKEPHEIALLREAARISIEGFREAVRHIRSGAGERDVEVALEAAFRRRGADGFAFPSIVASGERATVLHYIENDSTLDEGSLVLIDAGARFRMYNGDISRTFPVSGRFTPEQRALYDVVQAAKEAATATVCPGATIRDVHRAALRVLLPALVERALVEGEVEALIAREEEKENQAKGYKLFLPHQTSHWLGLAVHDVGDYAVDGEPRVLEPGMVLTVEPGLYFPSGHDHVPASLRGLGIRIEDDVLVTAEGNEVLTASLPTDAEAVEALSSAARD